MCILRENFASLIVWLTACCAACFDAHDVDRLLEKPSRRPWQPRWDIAPELTAVTRPATRFQEVAASLLPASG
jgi:hypothetical protein